MVFFERATDMKLFFYLKARHHSRKWTYKFMAYICLVDHSVPSLLMRSEAATQPITDEQPVDGAATADEGTEIDLSSNELQYIHPLVDSSRDIQHSLKS